MRRSITSVFRWIGAGLFWFVVVSVLWAGLLGIGEPPVTWVMLQQKHEQGAIERSVVDWTAISRNMPLAVMASEDQRFMFHSGFSWEAMRKAMERNKKGKRIRGGSTISQQTAKNAFLWPGRSYVRKGLEAYFAGLIEIFWGKPRIMEVYLNIVEMGPGIYGMPAASKHYFGTTVDRLSPKQAARLTAILPQPIKRSVAKPSKSVRRYARRIERRVKVVRDEGIDTCLWQ